jgi:hypothetical protein
MSSQEAECAPPRCEKYQHWAKGLWALGGSSKQRGDQTQCWRKADAAVERGYEQTTEDGAYANQHLNSVPAGKAHGGEAKASNRTREIRLSGIIGGPRET